MKTIKIIILLTTTSLMFNSCIISEFDSDKANIIFKTYWHEEVSNSVNYNHIIIGNDTLNLKTIQYVITDLKLVNQNRTINITDSKLMSSYENIALDITYSDIYQISFNFGIEDITNEYGQLKAQNFDIEDGYYFLKMDFLNKAKDSLYNYNIAKKNSTSQVKSFKVTIDGFDLTGSLLYGNQAVIGLNLKNLFTKPNLIDIESLTSNSLGNEGLQIKMTENAKNIFYLESFSRN